MKQIKPIIYIVAGLIAILLIANAFGQCTEKRNEQAITQADLAIVKQAAIDSVVTANVKKETAKIDSLQKVSDMKIAEAKRGAAYWENIANKRKVRADNAESKADSLANEAGEQCAEVIDAFRSANKELKGTNEALVNQITEVEKEAQEWCEKYELSENEILVLRRTIEVKDKTILTYSQEVITLKKRLKRTKNGLWIGFGVGLASGVVISR